MRRLLAPAIACVSFSCAPSPALRRDAAAGGPGPALQAAGQLLVVRASAWSATAGELRRFQRGPDGAWTQVGGAVPVMLGKGGLGWGRGLHGGPLGEPAKREGDGRAPAGAFALGTAFGYAPSAPGRMPYLQATSTLECVDDDRSPRYNELFDSAGQQRSWTSSERMRRDDALYELGLVVQHNPPPGAVAGAGSCIFLHVWKDPGAPTVGCTSMARAELAEVLAWLDPALHPALVQLPDDEYARLRGEWRLP